ncbi:MAG TPA: hypothetical protein VGC79_25750, partial [Polyangiaceae bacterium]
VWLPACFLALIVVLEKRRALGRGPLVAAALALSVTVLSHSYNYGALLREDGFGGIPPETVRRTAWAQSRYEALLKVLRPLPPLASVAASSYLVSFVAGRPEACDLLRPCGRPEYVLLSSREVSAARQQLKDLFSKREYRLLASGFDEFYLFQHAPAAPATSETPETRAAIERLGLLSP